MRTVILNKSAFSNTLILFVTLRQTTLNINEITYATEEEWPFQEIKSI